MNNLIPNFIIEQYKLSKTKGTFSAFTMFVDISGFTKLTETLMKQGKEGAEVLTDVLNNLFNPMVKDIYRNHGIISTFAGGAFTAIFKKSNIINNSESNVLRSALFVNNLFNENRIVTTKFGDFEMGVKVGLSFGKVDWGILGSGGKHTYYFRGQAIDGCAKSEHHAEKGDIIIDNSFLSEMNKNITFSLDCIDAKSNFKDHFKLIPKNIKFETINNIIKKKILNEHTKKITKKDLSPFIADNVISFNEKAEFRDIVSVFISFREPKSFKLLNNFITKLIESSYKYGGYLNKIDFGDKGGIALILFGAPKSYENNIERALNFILNQNQNRDLDFRAGITFGTVYAGIMGGNERCEYTAIGDIVNLSARFMMKSDWNKFWVSENIFNSQKKSYEFNNLGKFKFKGKSGTIPSFELVKKKTIKRKNEINLFEGKIIGRKKELNKLNQIIDPIIQDKKFTGVIYIYGEAGIGKSRLVWEFRKTVGIPLQKNNHISWFNFPSEEILRKSLNPIIYFLQNYFEVSEENTKQINKVNFNKKYNSLLLSVQELSSGIEKNIASELTRTKSILAGYIGIEWNNSLYSKLDAKGRYDNFLYAVKELIKAESLLKPVIIEFEDSQFIDNDTQNFLKVLTTNINNFPIAIICLARYDDDGSEFIISSIDKKVVDINKINLGFLDKKDISSYSRQVLNLAKNKKISEKLLTFISDKTNGNPFFIEQLLLNLKELGIIKDSKKDKYTLDIDNSKTSNIPTNIQAVIISRLDRLSGEVKKIVQSSSILGREFYIKVLSSILKNDLVKSKKLDDILDEKIWTTLSRLKYIFNQAMLRDSAYDMQLKKTLKELHKLAAQSYLDIYKDDLEKYYADIAYHFDKAEDVDNALIYLEKAGNYARDNYFNQNALDYFERWLVLAKVKLGLTDDDYSQVKIEKSNQMLIENLIDIVVFKISTLYSVIFHEHEKANLLLNSIINLSQNNNDQNRDAEILCEIGVNYSNIRNFKNALNYLNKSHKIFVKTKNKRRICSVYYSIGLIYYQTGEKDKAISILKKSLKISKEIRENKSESNALSLLGLIYDYSGDMKKGMEFYKKSLEISRKINDKFGIQVAIGNIGVLYSLQGDYNNAIKQHKEKIKICKEIGNIKGKAIGLLNIGNEYFSLEDYDKSLKFFEDSLVIFKEINDFYNITNSFLSISHCYNAKDQYHKSIKDYDNTKILIDKHKINSLLPSYYIGKAEVFMKIKKNNSALILCKQGIIYSKKNNQLYLLEEGNTLKDKILQQINNRS